jgi:transposase
VWISGALNFKTGRLHWVSGERRNDELFVRLLDKMRRTYRWHKELHLAVDNDSSHTSKRVKEYVEDSGGRVRLHPLPSWSPESNPVELVWWSLHEAVSRNHECEGLEDLVEFAESYLKERQPFRLKLGEVYDRLERPRLEVGRVSIYLVELSSIPSTCPDIVIHTSRFEPLSARLGPLGRRESAPRLQRRLRRL